MDIKEIKIKIPDGYEIDRDNSTFECIKFKRIEKKPPKTWEEFCENNPLKVGESWTAGDSMIFTAEESFNSLETRRETRRVDEDKNVLPSK